MATGNFPTNFPNGPIVTPETGRLAPGQNGTFFMLALFNRTGGPSGTGATPAVARQRTVADGLTISMLSGRTST